MSLDLRCLGRLMEADLASTGTAVSIAVSIAVMHRTQQVIALVAHGFAAEGIQAVRLRSTRRAPEMTLERKHRWHGFVSHYWNSAQAGQHGRNETVVSWCQLGALAMAGHGWPPRGSALGQCIGAVHGIVHWEARGYLSHPEGEAQHLRL